MDYIKQGDDHFYFRELLPYEEFLKWQSELLQKVRENRTEAHFICCSHPEVFTLGRGLQKKTGQQLIDFDAETTNLPYPLFKIKRGGGLTFHHPGQFIFYAIINLNRPGWSLKFHYVFLLKNIQRVLKHFDLETICSTSPAGIWVNDKKLASIGVGVEHFVTTHGLALNLHFAAEALAALTLVYPCGLNSSQYVAVDQYKKGITFKSFAEVFKRKLILDNQNLEF